MSFVFSISDNTDKAVGDGHAIVGNNGVASCRMDGKFSNSADSKGHLVHLKATDIVAYENTVILIIICKSYIGNSLTENCNFIKS